MQTSASDKWKFEINSIKTSEFDTFIKKISANLNPLKFNNEILISAKQL